MEQLIVYIYIIVIIIIIIIIYMYKHLKRLRLPKSSEIFQVSPQLSTFFVLATAKDRA